MMTISLLLVAISLACFALTRRLHRSIPGT